MLFKIDAALWAQGFREACTGQAARGSLNDDDAYALGRNEGEALRRKHRDELERAVVAGCRMGTVSTGDKL